MPYACIIPFSTVELHKYYKKNQSFDGRKKKEKSIFWSVELSFMQFKNEQNCSTTKTVSDTIIDEKEKNCQVNPMRMWEKGKLRKQSNILLYNWL